MTTDNPLPELEAMMGLVRYAVGPYPQPGGASYKAAVDRIEAALRRVIEERDRYKRALALISEEGHEAMDEYVMGQAGKALCPVCIARHALRETEGRSPEAEASAP